MSEETKSIIERAEELCVLCEEEEAEILVRDALKKDPENLDLKTELAVILSRRGYDHKTESILREVLEIDGYHQRATSSLGNLLGNSLRHDEAEELFRSYLAKQPHGHMILDDLSRLLYDLDRIEEAYIIARKHIMDYPQEIDAYAALKYVLEMHEDDLATELAEDPTDVEKLRRFSENLVEQHFILQKMKACENVDDCEDSMPNTSIDEDIFRVVAEIQDIRMRNNRNKEKLSSALVEMIEDILDSAEFH